MSRPAAVTKLPMNLIGFRVIRWVARVKGVKEPFHIILDFQSLGRFLCSFLFLFKKGKDPLRLHWSDRNAHSHDWHILPPFQITCHRNACI